MSPIEHAIITTVSHWDYFEAACIIQNTWKTYVKKKHNTIITDHIPKWHKFISATKTHWVWIARNLEGQHFSLQKNKFPKPIFSQNESKKNKEHGGIKLRKLTQNDLIKLYKIGNPLIPEKQGGLKLKDIYIYIHNSGAVVPTNKPFFHFHDHGHTVSMSFRRIWSIVNETN